MNRLVFGYLLPIFFTFFLLFGKVVGSEVKSLQRGDVARVMQEIFNQQPGKQGMNDQTLKNSLKNYINQFDPNRIYLLEGEVSPFLNMPSWQVAKVMSDYQKSDFSIFEQVNEVIGKAIERSRKIRSQIPFDQVFQLSQKLEDTQQSWEDPDLSQSYPKNLENLEQKIADNFAAFVKDERLQYGNLQLSNFDVDLRKIYEEEMRDHEDGYLYVDGYGKKYSPANKENIFVTRVLKALAISLDNHTRFFSNEEANDMKMRLEKGFYGTGIIPVLTSQGIVVERILEGSPAAKSGKIFPSDLIEKVDGLSPLDTGFREIEEKIVGDKAKRVSLEIRKPNGGLVTLELPSDLIIVNEGRADVAWDSFQGGIIGKITLHSFYKGEGGVSSFADVMNGIDLLKRQGKLEGLILDLRENSGGFLLQAVKVAGLFISNGVVVVSKYSNGERFVYRDVDGKSYFDGPMVILTSKATASAAEIVAQTLQDYGVALVVGDEHTYGKGTIQSQTVTDNDGSHYFKVTVGNYYTVSGKTPQKKGVIADIIVPSQYAYDHIGEEYLDSAKDFDAIPSLYQDMLSDVSPALRSWYAKYYTPYVQNQTWVWREMLSTLKSNSHYRLANNKKYSQYMSRMTPITFDQGEDLQMNEAEEILRDMIRLAPQENVTVK